jgi:hypothetical protein
MFRRTLSSRIVSESEIKALKIALERSKAARLRAWSVLQGLRDTLQAAGVIIPPSSVFVASISSVFPLRLGVFA